VFRKTFSLDDMKQTDR